MMLLSDSRRNLRHGTSPRIATQASVSSSSSSTSVAVVDHDMHLYQYQNQNQNNYPPLEAPYPLPLSLPSVQARTSGGNVSDREKTTLTSHRLQVSPEQPRKRQTARTTTTPPPTRIQTALSQTVSAASHHGEFVTSPQTSAQTSTGSNRTLNESSRSIYINTSGTGGYSAVRDSMAANSLTGRATPKHNLYQKSMQFVAERKERKLKELQLIAMAGKEQDPNFDHKKAKPNSFKEVLDHTDFSHQIPSATPFVRSSFLVDVENDNAQAFLNTEESKHHYCRQTVLPSYSSGLEEDDDDAQSSENVSTASFNIAQSAPQSSKPTHSQFFSDSEPEPEIPPPPPPPQPLHTTIQTHLSPHSSPLIPSPLHNIFVRKTAPPQSRHDSNDASSHSNYRHLNNLSDHPTTANMVRIIRLSSSESSRRRKEARFKELSRRAELYSAKRLQSECRSVPSSSTFNNKYIAKVEDKSSSKFGTKVASYLQQSPTPRHNRKNKINRTKGKGPSIEFLLSTTSCLPSGESPLEILLATTNCNCNCADVNSDNKSTSSSVQDDYPYPNGKKLVAIKRSIRDELLLLRKEVRRAKRTSNDKIIETTEEQENLVDVSPYTCGAFVTSSISRSSPNLFGKNKPRTVQFSNPMVTDVRERPYTDPEDIDDLFFGEDELNALEMDRVTVENDQFELIAVPTGTVPECVLSSIKLTDASTTIFDSLDGGGGYIGGNNAGSVTTSTGTNASNLTAVNMRSIVSHSNDYDVCVSYKNKMDVFASALVPAVEEEHLIPLSPSDLSALIA